MLWNFIEILLYLDKYLIKYVNRAMGIFYQQASLKYIFT